MLQLGRLIYGTKWRHATQAIRRCGEMRTRRGQIFSPDEPCKHDSWRSGSWEWKVVTHFWKATTGGLLRGLIMRRSPTDKFHLFLPRICFLYLSLFLFINYFSQLKNLLSTSLSPPGGSFLQNTCSCKLMILGWIFVVSPCAHGVDDSVEKQACD